MKTTIPTSKTKYFASNPDNFALIIGAMKCGTTSLFEILSQHPQICASRVKEPDYFIKDREDESCGDYLALWDWKSDSHVVALESSVAYTKSPFISGVPERISRAKLGKYRFIYMMRDPLARIESQVRHGIFAGWGKSLDAGITEDLIDFSRYAEQLDNYLEYFTRNDIMLVTLEEFKIKPYFALGRICKFLGVDDDFHFSKVEEPRNTGELFNASPAVARITQGGFGQFVARRLLPARMKKWLRSFIGKLSKGKEKDSTVDRWRLKPEERILILNRLADDLRRLESDYGIDVRNYWHVPSQILDRS